MSESIFKRKTKVIDDDEVDQENLEQEKLSHQKLEKNRNGNKVKNGTSNSLNGSFI